jgi:hypothetical protein
MSQESVKPFYVPICRQDRAGLHPDIASAFDTAYAALRDAMTVCHEGLALGLADASPRRAFWGTGLEGWWMRADTFSPLVTAARLALKPVHGRLTLAQQHLKGNLPSFAGTTGDCAHDVAVKIVGKVVSICFAQSAFLAMALARNDDGLPEGLRKFRTMEQKWPLIQPRLGQFAAVDCERLLAVMWQEAVMASDLAKAERANAPARLANVKPTEVLAAAEKIEPSANGDGSGRRGRLAKDDAEAKRAHLLATIRNHPSLKDDAHKLAGMIGVSESTVRRWIENEENQYRLSRAAQPAEDDEE